jgi:hypothetical protein
VSYRPEVEVSGKWSSNDLLFADRQEALDYAEDLAFRWWSVSNVRAVEDDRPATHVWADHKLTRITP